MNAERRVILDMRTHATRYIFRLETALDEEDKKTHKLLAAAVAEKVAMPDHYWQPQHALAEKLRAARQYVGVLDEILAELPKDS